MNVSESDLNAAIRAQNAFRGRLGRFINGCAHTRTQKLLSVVSSSIACRAQAGPVIEHFRHYTSLIPASGDSPARVHVDPYAGDNPHVLAMQSRLQSRLEEDLLGAYVHGSLGTGEEIKYSDFDALVILKSEIFTSARRLARVARQLDAARRHMLDFDILQHHGWFVLTEEDLRFYCDAYFPHALFGYAKSLLQASGQELELCLRDSRQDSRIAYEKLVDAVIFKLAHGKKPKNMYELKCLTSEIMLLPAFYLQNKTGAGVYKKLSFEQARPDFDPETWKIMDKISALRIDWEYAISPIQRRFFGRPGVLRDFLISRAGPEIPEKIAQELTPEFFSAIHNLARRMRAALDRV